MHVPHKGQHTQHHNNEVKAMKKLFIAFSACALAVLTTLAATKQVVDTYKFTMHLKIPRIYDNMESMGYRKLQWQDFQGELRVTYKSNGRLYVRVKNLVNNTHKIGGSKITYKCQDYDGFDPLLVAIGSNKSNKFKVGGIEFAFIADPSYNIGAATEDNTLMLHLSGYGKIGGSKHTITNLQGAVTGQIGCGCKEYGHMSPTRLFFGKVTDDVCDIAPVNGTFKATFKKRTTKK